MFLSKATEIAQTAVTMEGATGCRVRQLIGDSQGAPHFAMREFTVEPGGHTPRHQHPYEHEIYVLQGTGLVLEGQHEHAIAGGDVILIKPNEVHQFRNPGADPLKFLCLIPNSAAQQPVTLASECSG